MHIEPGIVHGAKMALGYATAAGAAAYTVKLAADTAANCGATALLCRTLAATAATFAFFELLPHFPVGVSELHFILGTTLFLLLGAAPAAIGLAFGLLIQGLFFAPADLPQYAVNLTTLLVPLFAIAALAHRLIPPQTAYVDLRYATVLKLSLAYQGGVVAWVAFWALYGQGVGAQNLGAIMSFGAAYMLVVLIEPLVDLGVLAGAKALRGHRLGGLLHPRVHGTA